MDLFPKLQFFPKSMKHHYMKHEQIQGCLRRQNIIGSHFIKQNNKMVEESRYRWTAQKHEKSLDDYWIKEEFKNQECNRSRIQNRVIWKVS